MSSTVDLNLPESLIINQAHELHDEFETLLEKSSCSEIVLHADKVSRVDTAGIQLLLALVKATRERSIDVSWDAPSAKLQEVAGILGLSTELDLH